MRERWRAVPGWPGYEVSDLGRVRSVPRILSDGRRAGGLPDAECQWLTSAHRRQDGGCFDPMLAG